MRVGANPVRDPEHRRARDAGFGDRAQNGERLQFSRSHPCVRAALRAAFRLVVMASGQATSPTGSFALAAMDRRRRASVFSIVLRAGGK
jgi:hypothetical protein